MAEHTKTPWTVVESCATGYGWDIPELPWAEYRDSRFGVKEDAEFIVLAANAHDDLMAVAKTILKRLDLEAAERVERRESPVFPCAALRDDLRAAIAKGEQTL